MGSGGPTGPTRGALAAKCTPNWVGRHNHPSRRSRYSSVMRAHPTLLLLAVVPLMLVGCSTPKTIADSTFPDVPNGFAEELNMFSAKPIALWTHGRTSLAIITVSSVTCPPVPTKLEVTGDAAIAVTFVRSPNSPCSVDLSPTTHEFKVPEGIDPTNPVTVEVLFDFESKQTYELQVEG